MLFSPPLNRRFSLHARHTLKEARDIARYTKSTAIEPQHLLLALSLETGSLGSILLENMGFKKETLGKLCLKKGSSRTIDNTLEALPLSATTQEIIKRACFIASEHAYPYVGTEHLMGALLLSGDLTIKALTEKLAIEPEKITGLLETQFHFEQFPQIARLFEMPDAPASEERLDTATPWLDQYTVDLASEAKRHPVPVVGRELELERLVQILGRKEKCNALLIGEPGVGKTALVTALAEQLQAGTISSVLQGKRIRGLDMALLVAGTSFRGEFENRLKELLKEVRRDEHTILFIDELHTLVGTGNTQGGLDAANILKPALARGELQCIGATTLSEYKRHLEKDSALERRFQTILLKEPTSEETNAILAAAIPHYEQHHGVHFPKPLLKMAVTLSERFIRDRFLPDKAFDLIDEAGSMVRSREQHPVAPSPLHKLEQEHAKLETAKQAFIEQGKYDRALALEKKLRLTQKAITRITQSGLKGLAKKTTFKSVTEQDLLTVLANITHIPFEQLSLTHPSDRLAAFTRSFAQLFVGQPEVESAVIRLITRSLSPLRDPKRPLGSLLLMGPTGVGKTYLAQLLASEFLGDERSLIRLNMSEFMERHSTARLLGAPAGYVGYGEGGKLTEAVRRQPYSIVLFDEIEKAHPDIANLLLQILDEGFLTDAEGRRVSFRNTFIVLTSNIGTASFTQAAKIGFTAGGSQIKSAFETIKIAVLQEMRETLRPELLARLDEVLVFEPLSEAALKCIAEHAVRQIKTRLTGEGIALHTTPGVYRTLARQALTQGEGARQIKKYIRDSVEFLIAQKLMAASPKKITLTTRHDTIVVQA